ncbi:glycosyltransferase [Candidatus Aminicenantes bacterium AC-334-K16]|nr:glycosyltransferase [Candidatus Aminicenantes bacterium AC-334-K16]
MKANNNLINIVINPEFSTTRNLTKQKPIIVNNPSDKFKSVLFLNDSKKRIAEGGLRTKGYFKMNLPNKPLISIITVVYNNKKYLENAILSVLKQTYENVEYIIIDGGSRDGTLDIIQKYENAIDYWVSEEDKGIYDAMNKGIIASQGEIIGILNSDDWYEKGTLEIVAHVFYNDKSIDLVHGAMKRWEENGIIHSIYGNKEGAKDIFWAPFNHPTCFFRKRVYKKIGLFDCHFSLAADYDFMLRFKRLNLKSSYVDNILTNFRMVGKTSKLSFSPISQIWMLLKKNDYSLYERILAITYRIGRDFFSKSIDVLNISKIKHKFRKYLSYHKKF